MDSNFIELETYVNWELARAMIMDVRRQTDHLLQLCDSILVKMQVFDQVEDRTLALLEKIDLTDEQVHQLSMYYIQKVADLKFAVSTLQGGEINHDPNTTYKIREEAI